MPTYVVAGTRLIDLDRISMMVLAPVHPGKATIEPSRIVVSGEGFDIPDHAMARAIWKRALAHLKPEVLQPDGGDDEPPPGPIPITGAVR